MTKTNEAVAPDQTSVIHSTFTIERIFEVPPKKVFHAFADKETKRRWLIEGEGWNIHAYEADFRVGGSDASRFDYQGGPELTNDTQYQDIVPDQRIVFSYRMTMGGKPLSASLVTVEFTASGKGTVMTYTEQGAYFDGGQEAAKGREEGTRWLMDRLAAEVVR